MPDFDDLTPFVQGYVVAALWSSTVDDQGTPMDQDYTSDDLAPEALQEMLDDCNKFQEDNKELLAQWRMWFGDDRAGHDFWLTRNHHGAGFWDRHMEVLPASRDVVKELGEKLTEACGKCGERNLYIGDDGKIHECEG